MAACELCWRPNQDAISRQIGFSGHQQQTERAIAELLFQMGWHDEGEVTFAALTKDFPEDSWGYIAWGDIYNPTHPRKLYGNTAADIERAKRLYRIPIVRELEDKEGAGERLEELLDYERETATMLDA